MKSPNLVQSFENLKKQLPEEKEYVFIEFLHFFIVLKKNCYKKCHGIISQKVFKTLNPKPWPWVFEV